MNLIDIMYFFVGVILIAVCACCFLLKRILNILTLWNNGEPSQDDMNAIVFSKMKPKR